MSKGSKSVGAASLMLGALLLAGCNGQQSTCYGVEPDNEVEKLRPCPPGWKNGEREGSCRQACSEGRLRIQGGLKCPIAL